jgi:hypothetical protein
MTTLPLTPFETYLLEDDLPGHPCWQFVRLRWAGALQAAPLGRAWAEATARQPLLTAVVRRGALGPRWVLGATAPTIHFSTRVAGREWPDWLPLDLATGPGARLYVIAEGERTDVILAAHHAVCDGLSLLDVLEDAFVLYARLLGDPVEPRAPASLGALRRRGRIGATFWERCWLPALQVAGIVAEAKLLRRTVAPLLPHVPAPADGALPPGWPNLVTRFWSEADSAAIREAAKRLKSGLPEMVTRDLQAAIGAWRLAAGVDRPEDWIRLGSAVSLRRKTRGAWPVANLFGIALIERSARSLADRGRLLRRATEDLGLVEKWRFGYALWMLLRLRRFAPGGIRAYARRPVVRMTMVLSFIGKVFSRTALRRRGRLATVPGAVLETVEGLAPTRPGTCASIDVAIVQGVVGAFLNYDGRVLSAAQAQALLDAFGEQLALSVAGR